MAKLSKNVDGSLAYNKNLRAEIETDVNESPRARVHSVEWRKIQNGDPVEINPSVGHGYRIMTVAEWAARWKVSVGGEAVGAVLAWISSGKKLQCGYSATTTSQSASIATAPTPKSTTSPR